MKMIVAVIILLFAVSAVITQKPNYESKFADVNGVLIHTGHWLMEQRPQETSDTLMAFFMPR